ncbi:MAG: purine-nucleoside phosphorylase [Kiritimatiellae bacterium]|nr:purine-nucleoside phosphorylase [Kiritimatiellia bacterium]
MIDTASLAPAFDAVSAAFPGARPAWGMVLGSGWSEAAAGFEALGEISFADIPRFGAAGVAGHAGRLLWGRRAGVEAFIFRGRRHVYEGVGFEPVIMPVYLAKRFGAKAMFLTNAAGGVRKEWNAGDLMAITDHINLMGVNPLVGPHDPFWGARFPDQSAVWSPRLRKLLAEAAEAAGVALREGVYLAGTGPTYETPAEVRAFRAMGADAVGMSTVPEAILANAAGLEVVGVTCITNMASGILDQPLTHEEVTETTAKSMEKMRALVLAFADRFAAAPTP